MRKINKFDFVFPNFCLSPIPHNIITLTFEGKEVTQKDKISPYTKCQIT